MFDSHFHLTDPRLSPATAAGVEIGANFEELSSVFEFAKNNKTIFCTAGVHPCYATEYSENDFENFIVNNLTNEKFVAIGECGLDYHRKDLPIRDQQIKVFLHQINMAYKYKKPLVVHSRDAWEDTAEILIANKSKLSNGVLLHCMSYTADNAKYILSKLNGVDVYFAFGGHITYKDKTFLHETLLSIPRDKILIETDAPYLAPVPKKGEVNKPEYIKYTALKIAEILDLTVDEVDELTTKNAMNFYKIKTASM